MAVLYEVPGRMPLKIVKEVTGAMLANMPSAPPEIGGIFGGSDECVTEFFLDRGKMTNKGCGYVPDTERLNAVISDWEKRQVNLLGIFHTHFISVETLSVGDISYIERIMKSMPQRVRVLYFPIIVLPEKHIVPYIAKREGSNVLISRQELIII